MANINITLNQEEILYLLSTNKEDTFKKLFQETLNAFILEVNDTYHIRRSSSIPLSINEDMNNCSSELITLAEEQHLLLVA